MKPIRVLILMLAMALLLPSHSFAQLELVEGPEIQSETAILIDATSGAVLFDQKSHEKMYPASITKIVTAILAIESNRLDEIVTVSKRAREVDGTRVYLEEGEQVPLMKLVQGLMINSGNDAGVAIAEHLAGSVEAFAEQMNDFATKKIGVKDTHFENPHGLFGEEHYSTAYDFAMITKYAITNPTFREIMGTSEFPWKGESWDTTIFNHHWMLREWPYEGVIGGKNGYIDQSGHTLVTAASRENLTLIAVVLKATTKRMMYNDTEKLFDFGFANFETGEVTAPQEFTDDNQVKYQLEDPIYYTKKIGETVDLSVDTSGELSIIGEDERLISAQQLFNPLDNIDKSKIVEGTKPLGKEYATNGVQPTNKTYVIISIVVFLFVAFIYLRRRKRRRRARMYR